MKQLTYNRGVALSIIMAAALLREHPNAKVETTEKDGTDFETLAKEANLKSGIIELLKDESERSNFLSLGIVTDLNDVENFEHSHKLMRLFNGDEALENELVATGKVVNNFIESPYFESKLREVNSKKDATSQKPQSKAKKSTATKKVEKTK